MVIMYLEEVTFKQVNIVAALLKLLTLDPPHYFKSFNHFFMHIFRCEIYIFRKNHHLLMNPQ